MKKQIRVYLKTSSFQKHPGTRREKYVKNKQLSAKAWR